MHFTRKNIIAVIGLFFLLLLSGCKPKEEPLTEEQFIDLLREPTVMITVGESRASGVIVGKDEECITIATVAHLMSGYDQGIITFCNGKTGFGDVFYCNEADDICLLKIAREDMTKEFVDTLSVAKIDTARYDSLETDDEVFLAGSQVGVAANVLPLTFKTKDYYVPEFDSYYMYLYGDVFPGMSGSGLYDKDGYLIGLLAGGSETSEALCIPVTDVIEVWNLNK